MKNSKDSLGDRMKRYESVPNTKLVPRSYAIIRLDGKAFHTFTKGLTRPWDPAITETMEATMQYLCENIQGVKYGFYQSDEISLVLTDFDTFETSAWFDNKIQKMVSVSASLATAKFNNDWIANDKLAIFDARIFNVPNREEVINYFIWRQQDTVRNSISSLGQSLYSSKELHGKKSNEVQEMCFQKGYNWNDVSTHLKRGTGCYKRSIPKLVGLDLHAERTEWFIDREVPTFSDDREYFNNKILNQE